MKATNEFFDYSILSVTSQDANFPVSNIKVYDSSTISWHSSDTSEQIMIIDLLSARIDPIIFIYRSNFNAIKFYGNSANEWGGEIPFDSGELAITKDPKHGIYKLVSVLSGFNYRYLRIVIPNQATLDGKSYLELGVLGIFISIEDFSALGTGFSVPVETNQIQNEIINRSETNRKSIVMLSDIKVLEINLSGSIRGSVANQERMEKVFGNPSKSLIFIDRSVENSYHGYIVQRMAGMNISEQSPGNNGIIRYGISLETIL